MKGITTYALLCLLTGLFLASQSAAGQTPVETELAKLLAGDAESGDEFGWSVAVDGDTAVIGARSEDSDPVFNNGAAYVFVRNAAGAWQHQAKLLADDRGRQDSFGWSVALDGNTAVVGATDHSDGSFRNGAVYVFVRDGSGTWVEQAKLLAEDRNFFDRLGRSVAIDGDTVVVGAPEKNVDGIYRNGAAYVFTRDADGNWSQQARLVASDAAAADFFGQSVDVAGDIAVIGTPGADVDGISSVGAAYVFTRDSQGVWTERTKLFASDRAATDRFGGSVAIDGNTLLVGAVSDDLEGSSGTVFGSDRGAAYVFVPDAGGWSEQAKLIPNDGNFGDEFGSSVALDGDTAAISARGKDNVSFPFSPVNHGAVYAFVRGADGLWTQRVKLLASDRQNLDYLGFSDSSVSVSNGTVVAGAVFDDDNGTDSGSAYVFQLAIDDEPPEVSGVAITPNPVAVDTALTLVATTDDSATGGSGITAAGYELTQRGVVYRSGDMTAVDGAFDEVAEALTSAVTGFGEAGVFNVCVRATDTAGNTSAPECVLLAVYDPEAGFVTGGGWIESPAGAYTAEPTLTGKANFGFVSRYRKGAQTPSGNTEFSFRAGDLNFHSSSYEWLVIAGARAQYKGVGTINGAGSYGFMLTAIDADLTASTDADLFRIKIWDLNSGGNVVYDNQLGAGEDAEPTTRLGGGSIVIHAGRKDK